MTEVVDHYGKLHICDVESDEKAAERLLDSIVTEHPNAPQGESPTGRRS